TERLEKQFVQEGARRLAANDLLGSLPYFAEPLRIHANDPKRQEVHRLRLAAVMRQAPALLHVWEHDKHVTLAKYSGDGRPGVTISDGYARVYDADSGEPLGKPWRHEQQQARLVRPSLHVYTAAPPAASMRQTEEKPRSPYEGRPSPARRLSG